MGGIDLYFYENGSQIETWCDYPCVPRIGEKILLYNTKRRVKTNAHVKDVLYYENRSAAINITFNKFE